MGTIKDVLRWEWRVLRRAWGDTWSSIKGLGLWWDLALFLVPPVLVWVLGDSAMTGGDVLRSVAVGWGSVVAILALRGVWNYIWTPFKQDRELRDQLQEPDSTFPDIEVDLGGGPEFFAVEENDETEIQYIVLPDFTFVCREEDGASLDWSLTIEFSEDRPRLLIGSTRRELPNNFDVPGWRDDPNVLSPPIDFPRPGVRRGWLIFVSEGPGLWSQMASTETERSERGVFRVYLSVREYQSAVPGIPALEKSFGPWNMLVPTNWLNR